MRWLKAELHSHCNLDPLDYRLCDYGAEDLIRTAANLDYQVLAITCHGHDVWSGQLADYALSFGITLVPGMEVVTRDGKHILAYNFHLSGDELDTLSKMRSRKREDTLVIAPHPYFPSWSCLWGQVEENIELFDAIEHSGFFTPGLDFNARARRIAERHGKPCVGNGDVHRLWQLGRTWTWIEAEPEVTSIIEAVRAGRTRVHAEPLRPSEIARWYSTGLYRAIFPASPRPDPAQPLFAKR
jgi:predicted metal-dependent phosphoesterase TrpH